MIFVTVGTHEQQFNRLIAYVDDLKKTGLITEEVVIQTGFSTYEPVYCTWKKLYPYDEMCRLVKEARIVITHGGPSSFIMALQVGKVPVVVPRQKKFGEHVNDHQLEFANAVAQRQGNLLVVEEINELAELLLHYNSAIQMLNCGMNSNNRVFCENISAMIEKMFE